MSVQPNRLLVYDEYGSQSVGCLSSVVKATIVMEKYRPWLVLL